MLPLTNKPNMHLHKIFCIYIPHQLVCTVMSDLLEVPLSMRVEWRSASILHGEECVMTFGTIMMLLWSAGNWGMLILEVNLLSSLITTICTDRIHCLT